MTGITEDTLSPWGYLRDALADNPDADVYELAALASDAVPEDVVRRVLTLALVPIAREVVGSSRRNSMDGLSPNNNSPKMRDRASWWAKMLTERVSVGGVWKLLGECTFDDLQECIDGREQLISRVSGQIDNYKRLQKLMIQHKAKQVADVPAQSEWADQ